jgi:hypothetical protein
MVHYLNLTFRNCQLHSTKTNMIGTKRHRVSCKILTMENWQTWLFCLFLYRVLLRQQVPNPALSIFVI